jgi:hypothetical protein
MLEYYWYIYFFISNKKIKTGLKRKNKKIRLVGPGEPENGEKEGFRVDGAVNKFVRVLA